MTRPTAAAPEPPESATPAASAERPGPGGLLLWCLRDNAGRVAIAVIGGLLYQLALIGLPWCVERAVDQGITVDDPPATLRWAGVIAAVSVAAALGEIVLGWQSTVSATLTGNRLYLRLADRIGVLDEAALDRYGEGDLSMRGTRDVDLMRTWLMGFASFVTGVVGFTVMIIAILGLDPLLAVVGLACVPPLVVINTVLFPKWFGAANADLSAAHGARADAVEELLSASAAVRGLGGERALVERHDERSSHVTRHTLVTARVSASWAAASPFVPGLAIGVGLAVGGLAVLRDDMSIGGIVAFTSWMSMLVLWVGVLTLRLSQLSQARTAARRLVEVFATEPALARPANPTPLPATGDLVADGVTVRREGRTILAPTSLTARPGELVALTGPMASGKTTLLRVLAHLSAPSGGTVRYGAVPLDQAAPDELRARVAYVPQRPVTVSGTLADNLRLGGEYSDEELREACRLAALDDYLAERPDGLETPLGEGGNTLSGGQSQRLALARALLRKPSVLLLDDVTSAVDTETEKAIVERLTSRGDGLTVVFATHRPAVLAAADRVMTLEHAAAPAAAGEERVSAGG
ncbi:ABC transporter ATP-binding protein [Streptomyces buecherae]|uniref:ABC transporter ATP-binding protein n=1 Tax=Streptomyces buecherae TaxID=2763006 RepID=UPI0033E236C3